MSRKDCREYFPHQWQQEWRHALESNETCDAVKDALIEAGKKSCAQHFPHKGGYATVFKKYDDEAEKDLRRQQARVDPFKALERATKKALFYPGGRAQK